LAPGAYRVRELLPPGWRVSLNTTATRTITLAAAQQLAAVNFANTQRAAVLGRVFNDINGNGKQDSGEAGLSGWRVFVDANNDGIWQPTERSVLSDSNGDFVLASLKPGKFTIRVVPQAGFNLTTP